MAHNSNRGVPLSIAPASSGLDARVSSPNPQISQLSQPMACPADKRKPTSVESSSLSTDVARYGAPLSHAAPSTFNESSYLGSNIRPPQELNPGQFDFANEQTPSNALGGPGFRNQAENAQRVSFSRSQYQPQDYINPEASTCFAALGGDCFCPKCNSETNDIAPIPNGTINRELQNLGTPHTSCRFPTSVGSDSSQVERTLQPYLFPRQDSGELTQSSFAQFTQIPENQYLSPFDPTFGTALSSQQLHTGQSLAYYGGGGTGQSEGQFINSTSVSGYPNSLDYSVIPPLSVPDPFSTTSLQAWPSTRPNQNQSQALSSVGSRLVRSYQPPLASQTITNRLNVKAPQKRSYHKASKVNTGQNPESRRAWVPKTLTCKKFLAAQQLLDIVLKSPPNLSESEQKNSSELLGISIAQLMTCIEARSTVYPKMKQLESAAADSGIPAEHVTAWYLQMQPSVSSDDMRDSAYQTNIDVSAENSRPSKRLKKASGEDTRTRPYECTFKFLNGKFCSQLSKDYGDWKRHEEKHWPPRQWRCLINGLNTNARCYVCAGAIDLTGQLVTTTHDACVARDPRPDHVFLRRDKLVKHVKNDHQCSASIENWYKTLSPEWKRQCGFCGLIFSDSEWDKRCRHVAKHFLEGKKMDPDWKDPYPQDPEDSSQKPDDDNEDDNEDNSGNDLDEDDADQGDGLGNDELPYKDARGGNGNHNAGGGNDDQGRDDGDSQEQGGGASDSQDSSSQSNGTSTQKGIPGNQQSTQEHNRHDAGTQHSTAVSSIFSTEKGNKLPSNPSASQRANSAFTFVRKLGNGAFGVVEEIIHSESSTHFARKTIRANLRDSSNALAQVQKEVLALRQLKHEHIVRVLASYSTPDHFSIIMSPIAEGNLSDFMRSPALSSSKQRSYLSKWFGCLASALSYMHERDWLHVDLKPQNILVSGDRIFLSDFGSACPVPYSATTSMPGIGCAITPMYCAPELVGRDASRVATWASDIFSLGCIYLEMATLIYRESITTFEDLRSFGRGDKSFYMNSVKSSLWIERLWGIQDGFLKTIRQEDLQVIRAMLSLDARKRPAARSLERLYSDDYYGETEHSDADKLYVTKSNSKAFNPMAVASSWLTSCIKQHANCSNPAMNYFPTRILNVGTEGDDIRLQSRQHEFASPYVALSHCWGKGDVLRTTHDTIADRYSGIKNSLLSDDFQKAVRITRALGFNYLWIDSLCIVQDSAEDWVKESSQMHKIYSNSYLTICILNEEQLSPSRHQDPGMRRLTHGQSATQSSACSHHSSAFKPLLEDNASTMLLDSPLSRRGWALQERVLSPRVLHYSSTKLAWECTNGTLTFDATSKMRSSISKFKRFLSSFLPTSKSYSVQTAQSHRPVNFRTLWRNIVKEYSKRQLTISSDKLPALAGLAATISAADGCEYLAGLWKDDLKYGLLWCRDLSTPAQIRPNYRAPSWSWAAIDGPVVWSKSIFDLAEEAPFEVLNCSVTLTSPLSPFGGVSDGHLLLRAPMRKARVVHPYVEELLEVESRKPLAFAQWDALEPLGFARRHGRRRPPILQVEDVWCLQVRQGVGLMLKPKLRAEGEMARAMGTVVAVEEEFERVGMYWIKTGRGREEVEGGSWEVRTITIL